MNKIANQINFYLDFIKYSLNVSAPAPESVKDIDWSQFLQFCCEQGIQGIAFSGLERLGLRIPQDVLFEWIGSAEQIKQTNAIVNRQCIELSTFFTKKGYRSCILKGQANALFFPTPDLRCSGDIDVWVSKDGSGMKDDDISGVVQMVREMYPEAHFVSHHIELPIYEDTMVEVHYVPCYLNNWWYDRKLKKYIAEQSEKQFAYKVRIPIRCAAEKAEMITDNNVSALTDDFNVVFLMLHMYKHCFTSGNNFKQMTDYYYLLTKGRFGENKEYIVRLYKRFGVLRYARGVMWVMKDVLGLNKECLITEPDERFGRVLLEDLIHREEIQRWGAVNIVVGRFKDNFHLWRFFPIEIFMASLHLLLRRFWKMRIRR